MSLCVEVFIAYAAGVLLFSLLVSSEERVMAGREAFSGIGRVEVFVVQRFGCLIPYALVSMHAFRESFVPALPGILAEIAVYVFIKDAVIVYVKDLKVLLSPFDQLPINPSGHTFMFLNGIYIVLPVLYSDIIDRRKVRAVLSLCVLCEYNRLLMSTVTYYHTFTDVALGMAAFLLFRGMVYPVRRVYKRSTYTNEWGIAGCLSASLLIIIFTYMSHIKLTD